MPRKINGKRRTNYKSKQVEKDVCQFDNTWLKTLTRCQVNMNSGNLSLQTGLMIRQYTITFSNAIEGVIV